MKVLRQRCDEGAKEMRVETERLILRSFEEKDADGVLRLWANPRANCYVRDRIRTREEALQRIRQSKPEYDLAVCLQAADTFMGTVFGLREEPDTLSPCWNFLPEYGGKGYAFEAATAYFTYLFGEKGIRRLYAYTDEENSRSQKLCRKLGMRQEGFFKEFMSFVKQPDGTPFYENTFQFALLKKEWQR